MVAFPNAKINLGLNVLRRRDDGYHDITTVMVPVDWCDVLEVVPSSSEHDRLFCTGHKIDCPPDKNLVMKALRVMRMSPGILIPPLDIYLHKNIPDGAGLGGGSADAAFLIKTVNQLMQLNLTDNQMVEMAAKVGSDCAFFIYNVPCVSEGRGEILKPIPWLDDVLKDYQAVIIKPENIAVSTSQAYSSIRPCVPDNYPESILKSPMSLWKDSLSNDFEKSDLIGPNAEGIKDILYNLDAEYSSLSGSGSAVYAIFKKNELPSENTLRQYFPTEHINISKFVLNT